MASKEEAVPSEYEPLVHYKTSGYRSKPRRKTLFYILLLVVLIVVVLALVIGLGAGLGTRGSTAFYRSVKAANLLGHLRELDNIAVNNEQSRAVQYGYNDSAEWVIGQLEAAGYTNITRQEFVIGSFELLEDNLLSATFTLNNNPISFDFTLGSQFSVMRYSGNASIEGAALSIVQNYGCDPDDYTEGNVNLVDYNTNETETGCSIYEMVTSAESAGVVALLMMRTEDDPQSTPPNARLYNQTVDDFEIIDLPVLGLTNQVGEILRDIVAEDSNLALYLNVNASTTFWNTYNVLAYTLDGATDSIIIVGTHLDSVPAGPGINDNGSGSMANLEMAIQLAKSNRKPTNQILFAFWGAEELGLLGSRHFVQRLTEDGAISNIALNLNYDMIGSPNYVRQVYNGSGAENPEVVKGSTKIQQVFEEFFKSEGLSYKLAPFTGRSDYGPFIRSRRDRYSRSEGLAYRLKEFNGRSDYGPFIAEGVDIPAGGLATGADERKTEEERLTYGGLANAILDPCYHQACDTIDNVDEEVYEQMSQCAAYVLEKLMMKEDLRDFLNN